MWIKNRQNPAKYLARTKRRHAWQQCADNNKQVGNAASFLTDDGGSRLLLCAKENSLDCSCVLSSLNLRIPVLLVIVMWKCGLVNGAWAYSRKVTICSSCVCISFLPVNIPPMKRMFTWMASQYSEGISRIAMWITNAAGKNLFSIGCCVPYRQLAALRGSCCCLLPMILSQVVTPMWMQGFVFTKMFCFSSSQVIKCSSILFSTCGGRRPWSRPRGLQISFMISFVVFGAT